MHRNAVIVALALSAVVAIACPFARAQAAPERSMMAQIMGEMQQRLGELRGIIGSEDADLADALEPLHALQAGLVEAKSAPMPADLGDLEQPIEESQAAIRRGLAEALGASATLELAILSGDRSGATEALEALGQIQRDGHNATQFPLRVMRRDKMLAELDDLPIEDGFAAVMVGVYHIAELGRDATMTHTEEGRLTIQVEGQPLLDLRLQANGDLRPTPAPQVIVRPIMEGERCVAIEVHQNGRVARAARKGD